MGEPGSNDPTVGGQAVEPMRKVTLEIRHNGQPECIVSTRYPGVTMQSVSSMTGRENRRKRIIELTGNPDQIVSFIQDFERQSSIVSVDPVTPLEEPTVHVSVVFDFEKWDSIAALLSELGIHYRTGTVISGGWERWTLYLDQDDDLSEVIEVIEGRGNDTRLIRQTNTSKAPPDPRFEHPGILTQLTQRQRETLRTAVEIGYYNYSEDTSIDDVADSLDLSRSTVWEHLARAEEKLMTDIGELLCWQM